MSILGRISYNCMLLYTGQTLSPNIYQDTGADD